MAPIEGVTDRSRLPRLGKMRLGIKVEQERTASYPRAVDYFAYVCQRSARSSAISRRSTRSLFRIVTPIIWTFRSRPRGQYWIGESPRNYLRR